MTILEMLEQSAILTILGMAIVFIFLWIMIVCVNLTGRAIHKLGLDKDAQRDPAHPPKTGIPPQVTAAITAAVKEYQKNE
ncbi:MAG: OadG family protein [Treponema sp.]|jgi:oxaloacetate decarboxylase gamma subunit|nr:OadG family protein [Treponema sp.]